jgi:hypothetical protein
MEKALAPFQKQGKMPNTRMRIATHAPEPLTERSFRFTDNSSLTMGDQGPGLLGKKAEWFEQAAMCYVELDTAEQEKVPLKLYKRHLHAVLQVQFIRAAHDAAI